MWISKKKLAQIKSIELNKGWLKGGQEEMESQQWERIEKLEKAVKKLKKQVKNGW